jgi:hypothetical protein
MPRRQLGEAAASVRPGNADHAVPKPSCVKSLGLVKLAHQGERRAESKILELPRELNEGLDVATDYAAHPLLVIHFKVPRTNTMPGIHCAPATHTGEPRSSRGG